MTANKPCQQDREFVRRILKEWKKPALRGGSISYYSRFYVESWISGCHTKDELSATFAEPSLDYLPGVIDSPTPHRKVR